MIRGRGQAQARKNAAGKTRPAFLLLRVLLALFLISNGIGASVQAVEAAVQRWDAMAVAHLVDAGVLCAHDDGPRQGQGDPQHGCCDDGVACPCGDGILGLVPTALPTWHRYGFRAPREAVPASHLVAALPFKRGPPPRAPPHLMDTAQPT